jgi:hypothetical protein
MMSNERDSWASAGINEVREAELDRSDGAIIYLPEKLLGKLRKVLNGFLIMRLTMIAEMMK